MIPSAFDVHDAFETIFVDLSIVWSLRPKTTTLSIASRGGTVRITRRAPASMCRSSSLRVR